MKAVRIHNYGGPENLITEDIPRPTPAPGEILIHVRAASASPVDWKMREGWLQGWFDIPLPAITGRDFSGDIAEIGEGVTGFEVGQPVFGTVGQLGRGSYAQYITVIPEEIVPKPSSIDYEAAASVPHSGLAAWQALVETGRLSPGQKVLIHGAAGGVGSLAVQIAKVHGAYVIGTSSANNLDFLRDLGVDEAVDYNSTRFEDIASDVDLVLDTMGGDTQERSWAVMKEGGMMVTLVGFSPSSLEMGVARGARGELIGQRAEPTQLSSLGRLIDEGRIRPIVNRVMPVSEVREAQDLQKTGHIRGKIIIRIDDEEIT